MRLRAVEEEVEEVSGILQQRAGDADAGTSVNPVLRYKQGIQQLQREIRELSIATQISSQQLNGLRQCRQREVMRKQRNRHRSRKKGVGDDDST
jgi:hypothetical protein